MCPAAAASLAAATRAPLCSPSQLPAPTPLPLRWDGLEALRGEAAAWLWLPPTAPWCEVVAAAAERHAPLHARCLAAAVAAHNAGDAGGGAALTLEAAAALPWGQLPPQVQLLHVCELHGALAARFQRGGGCQGAAAELLAAAAKQAPACLAWLESQKRQGRVLDEQAYLAACAGAHTAGEQGQGGSSGRGGDAERQKRLVRVGLAFQEQMRRHGLVALSDLPLLARQLLAAGGAAAAWARGRWSVVLVVRA